MWAEMPMLRTLRRSSIGGSVLISKGGRGPSSHGSAEDSPGWGWLDPSKPGRAEKARRARAGSLREAGPRTRHPGSRPAAGRRRSRGGTSNRDRGRGPGQPPEASDPSHINLEIRSRPTPPPVPILYGLSARFIASHVRPPSSDTHSGRFGNSRHSGLREINFFRQESGHERRIPFRRRKGGRILMPVGLDCSTV